MTALIRLLQRPFAWFDTFLLGDPMGKAKKRRWHP